MAETNTELMVTKPPEAIPMVQPSPPPLPAPRQAFNNNFDMSCLLPSAGTLTTTKEQQMELYKPFSNEEIEIRPDGLIYLPWMEYVTRLRTIFGTNWALIPQGLPRKEGNLILWMFGLVIEGKLMGMSLGQQEYYDNNPMMTWGDAVEGAKSNALMRLCKGIGMGLELWKPSFIKAWKKKHAETYQGVDRNNRPKTLWRKKGSETITEPLPEPTVKDKTEPLSMPISTPLDGFPAMMSRFDKAKRAIVTITGNSDEYYMVLTTYGVGHANEFPDFATMEKALADLSLKGNELRIKAKKPKPIKEAK